MSGVELAGKIIEYDGDVLTIEAPFNDIDFLARKSDGTCRVILDDKRTITSIQRRKIFAIVADIGGFVSRAANKREYTEALRELQLLYVIDKTDNEEIRRQLTLNFCNLINSDVFSLSTVNVTTAREFIDWLIELCVNFDIPCNDTLLNRCEDINKYLYICVAKRRCAICGKKADIHEVEKVGMGGNRQKMHHLGQLAQPLCRLHHCEVESNTPQAEFNEKYHIEGIRLDEYLCKCIGWKA